MNPALGHINSWIFDLDNTLYPASSALFELVDVRMQAFIMARLNLDAAAARGLQKSYFRDHGTTIAGLIAEHGTDPHEFLGYVHDIDLDRLAADEALIDRIAALPGRRFVCTNGDHDYAVRVLDRLGLTHHFEGLHDIHAMALTPKPAASAYATLLAAHAIDPPTALFVEDMVRNLAEPKALGMTTLWVDNGSEQAGGIACPSFVDFRTTDLTQWLIANT